MKRYGLLTLLQAARCIGTSTDPEEESHPLRFRHEPLYRDFEVEPFLQSKRNLQSFEAIPALLPDHLVGRDTSPVDYSYAESYDPLAVTTSLSPSSETVQVVVSSHKPSTGTVITSLQTEGHITTVPIITESVKSPSSLISTTSLATPTPKAIVPPVVKMAAPDIFGSPISTGPPPAQIKQRKDHPVNRLGIEQSGPLQTNKFYGNLHLGTQAAPAFLHPYTVQWAKGVGPVGSWGLAISHVEARQRVFGPVGVSGAASYFVNPVGIQSIIISAVEFGSQTTLTTDRLTQFSVRINLRPKAQGQPAISFPLVQGAGFITSEYNGATPQIQTGVSFSTVTKATTNPQPNVVKYKMKLEDGSTWLLYARSTSGKPLELQVINNGLARAQKPFYGTIQIAKDPGGGEAVYDRACGAYATNFQLTGQTNSLKGTYNFKFTRAGLSSSKLLMFALPHHVSSFDAATKAGTTTLKLQTTVKGIATAIYADSWTMVEDKLPISMAFLPWSASKGSVKFLSASAKAIIQKVAQSELSQDMSAQSNQNSVYFSGKALAKFATILVCANDMLGDKALVAAGLKKLEAAMNRWTSNQPQYPLVYESAWGGLVSSATYVTGNSGADFGNTYYNDHHFHYGYFVYACAVLAHLDPAWLTKNKDYVNTLVRDYANPSSKDPYFPVSRNFDFYNGHSWAHGLFESYDGKDQESSSEDSMAAYAVKMWGMATGDQNMAARGNLMLAIQKRALGDYYLYRSDNRVQPPNFIGNKVAGILFENKIDHTTYFGNNIEYIQGIHMIPLQAFTGYTRDPTMVNEEWNTYFSNGRVDKVQGGWRGILYGNLATVNPKAAWNYFSNPRFDYSTLDGGASLTWYLCYSAALGGV